MLRCRISLIKRNTKFVPDDVLQISNGMRLCEETGKKQSLEQASTRQGRILKNSLF